MYYYVQITTAPPQDVMTKKSVYFLTVPVGLESGPCLVG